MDKRIDFKGVSLSPSDYECADDELAYAFNVDTSNGSYAVSSKYGELFSVSSDYTLRAVHHTETQDNYIFSYDDNGTTKLKYGTLSGNAFSFAQSSGADITFALDGDLRQVVPVGNTLVVSTTEGVYYMLWENSAYTWLGSELPEVKVKPYLVTEMLSREDFCGRYNIDAFLMQDIKLPEDYIERMGNAEYDFTINLGETTQQDMYDVIFGILNQLKEQLNENGKFYAPFFIRFAFRLYDGSHIHHTSPMLMLNGVNGCPSLYFNKYTQISKITRNPVNKAQLLPFMLSADLYFSALELPDTKWSDIIQGIDIFVSEPIITFSDSPKSLKSITAVTAPAASYIALEGVYQQALSTITPGRAAMKYLTAAPVNGSALDIVPKYANGEFWFMHFMDVRRGTPYYLNIDSAPATGGYYNYFVAYAAFKRTSATPPPFAPTFYSQRYTDDHVPVRQYARTTPVNDSGTPTGFPLSDSDYWLYKLELNFNGSGSPLPSGYDLKVYARYNTVGAPDVVEYAYLKYTNFNLIGEINMGRVDNKLFEEVISDTATFYKIKSYKLNELTAGSIKKVEIERGVLNALQAQLTLNDSGANRSRYTSNFILPYNNRLNCVIDKQYPQYVDHWGYLQMADDGTTTSTSAHLIGVEVVIDGQTMLAYKNVANSGGLSLGGYKYDKQCYFYYPDPNAKYMITLMSDNSNYVIMRVPLTEHKMLNGSYAFNINGLDRVNPSAQYEIICSQNDHTVEQAIEVLKGRYEESVARGNIIYTSDVNNPFRFDESNANAIQNSKILALATNTQALSEGQFGAHPLYAFTEDGVWALSVASDGAYSSVQPVSRDVLINKDSICSSDDSVFFGTERGIMQMSGSQLACITDILDGEFFNLGNTTFTSGGNTTSFIAALKAHVKNGSNVSYMTTPDDIKAFLGSCRMAYDYVGQRLVFYLPYDSTQGAVNPCMLVFNLRSKQWSMEENAGWLSAVNDYPDFCLNTAGASNKILSTSATRVPHDTMFVMTRPMKLDAPDVLKTVRQVLVRGILKRNDVQTMLYASRNLLDWVCIGTSTTAVIEKYSGTPYKYFSVGCYVPANVATSISKIKLSGLEIRFIPRDTNKLR